MSTTSAVVAPPSPQLSFPDRSTLDLLVPEDSLFNIQSHLNREAETRAESRSVLFFEELLSVYVILRSSLPSFENILKHVEISLTAHATPASPPPRLKQNGQTAPPEKPVKLTLDAITLTSQHVPVLSTFSHGPSPSCIVWKADLHLRYPSQKLHRPSVHLTATAVSTSSEVHVFPVDNEQDEYMKSAVPTSENLLQALTHGLELAGKQPCLPSSRLLKVAPRASPAVFETRPLRTSSRLFPVFSALAVRVHITPEHISDMLLSLDLEPTRHAEHGGLQLEGIETEGENVVVEPFSLVPGTPGSSVTLQTGDRSTFLYKLTQEHNAASRPAKPSSILFNISAVAHLSETCHVRIKSRWHGSVHFPQPQTSSKTSRNSLRPQSVASTLATQDVAPSRPMSKRMSHTGRPTSSTTNTDLGGVLFAFTGPEAVVEGETFHLDVFVVNRSARRKKLAVVAIPKPARVTSGGAQSQKFADAARLESAGVADAVLDHRTVYNMSDKREGRAAEVVCLNADVRVGPLPPGTCHNVQIEFLTLTSGLVGLAAIHVVDLETRETTQITQLPDIMVTRAPAI